MQMPRAKTQEEREAQRREIFDALKHTHSVSVNVAVKLDKPIRKRFTSLYWKCKCGAIYDGAYWYKREEV